MSTEQIEIAKLIVSILGFTGTIWAIYFGFRQYRRAEQWKRAEFVAKEIKDFEADLNVQNALQMIDWGERRINLFQTENVTYEEYIKVTREDQWRALLPHMIKGKYPSTHVDKDVIGEKRFTPEEVKIRDTYDVFLNYLQRFGTFIEANLVSPKELRPYLIYWLEAIAYGDSPEDDAWRCALLSYINYYGFSGVVGLFKAYDIDISPEGEIFKDIREKVEDKELVNYCYLLFNPNLLENYKHSCKTT